MRRLLSVIFLSIASCAWAEVIVVPGKTIIYPDELFEYAIAGQQPIIATFSHPKRHSFALGCFSLLTLWSKKIPTVKVAADRWTETMIYANVVGDIHCDERTKKIRTTEPDESDALLVLHRNKNAQGKAVICRHHVDRGVWFDVIPGIVIEMPENQLAFDYPSRGVNFNTLYQPVDPDPNLSAECLSSQ